MNIIDIIKPLMDLKRVYGNFDVDTIYILMNEIVISPNPKTNKSYPKIIEKKTEFEKIITDITTELGEIPSHTFKLIVDKLMILLKKFKEKN
jgi:hypothetical protein